MAYEQPFWLHIKKSAGSTVRKLLGPHYRQVDRSRLPPNFLQSSPSEHNDVLNNYRVVLGEYQYKRALFAKTYLFPDSWDRQYSFAFVREPMDRCVSMFYYLYWNAGAGPARRSADALVQSLRTRKLHVNASYAFDAFLDLAAQTGKTGSIYEPVSLAFTTHTANMWNDITDREGNVLLTRVYRLDDLVAGIRQALEACDLAPSPIDESVALNRNESRRPFVPSASQTAKIERIYAEDFELYERSVLH